MEDEERGPRLSKRFEDDKGGGEVDYKTKAGTAWSHNFLNQKPWHPLSYQNQRRKWIAEQTHAQCQRRAEEVAREYAQEQDFFRQNALISQKEKEKVETMKAVSFMYVRPPGYDPESAKAAEIADQMRKQKSSLGDQETDEPSTSVSMQPIDNSGEAQVGDGKKKRRPRDLYGRPLPTEEDFDVLKNAPKMDTGIQGRARPFGIEIRNVKCLRCGTFGHQSGDRECPLKDVIMPNEEKRLQRDDPLNAIIAQTDVAEPLKWELKQKPGLSPPRGGYNPDDPNQQIVAEEIFDEYGGFLEGGDIPDLLANFTAVKHEKKKSKRKGKHKKQSDASCSDSSLSASEEKRSKSKKKKPKLKKPKSFKSSKKHCSKHSDSDEDYKRKRKEKIESDDIARKGKLKRDYEPCDASEELRRTIDYFSESDDGDQKGKDHQDRRKSRHSKFMIDTLRSRYVSSDSDRDNVSKHHKLKRRRPEFDEDDRHKRKYQCSSSDEDGRRKPKDRRGLHLLDGDQLSQFDEGNYRSKSRRKHSSHRSQHPETNADDLNKNDHHHYREDNRNHHRHQQDARQRMDRHEENHRFFIPKSHNKN
ncbi:unnamed protein product [Rhodiola kirilowii]